MLRIATYNVHGCVGSDRQRNVERTSRVLAELDAQIIALQEVDSRRLATGEPLQWRALAAHLNCRGIAGPTLVAGDGEYGNAILTRLAPQTVELHDLSVNGREPRGAIDARFSIGDSALRVIATHLGLSPRERRTQVERLLELAAKPPAAPLVLLGDINEWLPCARPLAWLRARLAQPASPRTFPARWPLLALDRIFGSPDTLLHSVELHRSELARTASDHLPLVATIDPAAVAEHHA